MSSSPLARFADFYEQVATIKQAAAEGRLVAYLSVKDEVAPITGAELAGRVGARLHAFLDQQERAVRQRATSVELQAYRLTQYAMAAVADEVFALDLTWSGRQAWLAALLEARLFRTRNAGSRFFDFADQLIGAGQRSGAQGELAAVWLLALQLGFKGSLRGADAEPILQKYRADLFELARAADPGAPTGPAFAQAYAYCLVLSGERRVAPLGPWLRAGAGALLVALLVSGAVWFICIGNFINRTGSTLPTL